MSATGVESESRPDWAREINVGGTRNLLDAMRDLPVPPRLIFTSSLHVYGFTQDQPTPRLVTDPVKPTEHYSRHKVECEEMIKASGLTWAIFRLGAAFPLALKLDPGMFDVSLGNRIEFVHTRDVGLAIANGVTDDRIWGKVLHIGGGCDCQFYYRDLLGRNLDVMGVGMLPEDAFATAPFATDWLDTAESQALLGYQRRGLSDYTREMSRILGRRRVLVRLFRPLVRQWLLRRSPYWAARRSRAASLAGSGQVAVITGASSGIGAATALNLARQGMKVILVARRAERLEALAEHIREAGGTAAVIVADLSEESECQRVFEQVRQEHGAADVVVNNAGFGWYGFGAEMPLPLAQQMLQVNIGTMVRLTLLFLQDMKARGRGHIVNVGSVVGSLPSQGVALYGATKSFMDSFTTALYRELRGTGIHVSVVRAGAVLTEFYDNATDRATGLRIPVERWAVKPEAVAQRIAGLLKRPRRVVYVPGMLGFMPWIEPAFGWLIDRLGPLLLKRQIKLARQAAK